MSEDGYTTLAKQGRPVEGFVVDAHMHLGEQASFWIPHWQDLDLVVEDMDRQGVDVGCPASIPGCLGGMQSGANDMVFEALRRYPDRFFGWATFNPHYPDPMRDELARCHGAGCRGIKIHNSIGLPYDHDNYRIAYDFAAEHGVPILAHTWGADLDLLEPFFREYPGLKWALGHSGCVEPEKYARLAGAYEDVYLELCYSRSPRGLVEYFVAQGLGEKLLFGSDCYFMARPQQLGRVLFARISPEQKANILGENARRFFGKFCPR